MTEHQAQLQAYVNLLAEANDKYVATQARLTLAISENAELKAKLEARDNQKDARVTLPKLSE